MDAVNYWERKRIVYNLVLIVISLYCWGAEIVFGGPREWIGGSLILLVFAIIANLLFCMAYPVDLALQASPLKQRWTETRWVLFVSGLALASGLAFWILLRTGMG